MNHIRCFIPSMTTGRELPVTITGKSTLRRLLLLPYLKGECYSERLLEGWKWRKSWFRPSELIGYQE